MADPVSWLLIEPGWTAVASDGSDVGRIESVLGDQSADIFDGLAVAASTLGRAKYVPAEQVGEITEGRVHLTIDAAAVGSLGEYDDR